MTAQHKQLEKQYESLLAEHKHRSLSTYVDLCSVDSTKRMGKNRKEERLKGMELTLNKCPPATAMISSCCDYVYECVYVMCVSVCAVAPALVLWLRSRTYRANLNG